MSDGQATKKRKGKPATPAHTARGKAIQAHIRRMNLGLVQAAKVAGISFDLLHDAIHSRDPSKLRVRVVVGLLRLGVPLETASKPLHDALTPPASTTSPSASVA